MASYQQKWTGPAAASILGTPRANLARDPFEQEDGIPAIPNPSDVGGAMPNNAGVALPTGGRSAAGTTPTDAGGAIPVKTGGASPSMPSGSAAPTYARNPSAPPPPPPPVPALPAGYQTPENAFLGEQMFQPLVDFSKSWMSNPNPYGSELLTKGRESIAADDARARQEAQVNLDALMASRGVTGSSIEWDDNADLASRLDDNRLRNETALLDSVANKEIQGRSAAGSFGLGVGEFGRGLGADRRSDAQFQAMNDLDLYLADLQGRGFTEDNNRWRSQFDRGVYESDRGFERGTFENDRNFDRGVTESDRDNAFRDRAQTEQERQNQEQNELFRINSAADLFEAMGGAVTPEQWSSIFGGSIPYPGAQTGTQAGTPPTTGTPKATRSATPPPNPKDGDQWQELIGTAPGHTYTFRNGQWVAPDGSVKIR